MRALLLSFFFLTAINTYLPAQTIYYKLTKIVKNGQNRVDVSGGQFICFTKDGCYESDKEGYSVNNGSLKYKYTENGITIYSGTSYWGNATFKLNTDKSKLNVLTDHGEIYVYTAAAPPSNQTTCSLIRSNSSNLSVGITSNYPLNGYGNETTIIDNSNSTQQDNKRQNTSSKRWKNVTRTVDCKHCYHSGKCNSCNGKGYFYSSFGSGVVDCPNCYGYKTGLCRYCQGKGVVTKLEQVYE